MWDLYVYVIEFILHHASSTSICFEGRRKYEVTSLIWDILMLLEVNYIFSVKNCRKQFYDYEKMKLCMRNNVFFVQRKANLTSQEVLYFFVIVNPIICQYLRAL